MPDKEHIGSWRLFVAVLIYLPKWQDFDACHFAWEPYTSSGKLHGFLSLWFKLIEWRHQDISQIQSCSQKPIPPSPFSFINN
jgi:hypothetical protein